MKFLIGTDMYLEPDIQDEQIEVSPSTGKSLRRLVISFHGRGDSFRNEVEQLRQKAHGQGVRTADPSGVLAPEWRLGTVTSSYSGQMGPATVHLCTWVLEEKETLWPDALDVAGVVLHPDQYEEEFVDDRLQLRARVVLSADEVEALPRKLYESKTVTVVRHGINDTPRQMALTDLLWSANDSGSKVHLELSDPLDGRLDSKNAFATQNARFWRLATLTRETSAELARLVELLAQKAVLTEVERQDVISVKDDNVSGRWWNMFWVEDLDQWTM